MGDLVCKYMGAGAIHNAVEQYKRWVKFSQPPANYTLDIHAVMHIDVFTLLKYIHATLEYNYVVCGYDMM